MALQLFKISEIVIGGSQTTMTFSNIPQGYTDLMLKLSLRGNNTSTPTGLILYLNTYGTVYYQIGLYTSNGTTATTYSYQGSYGVAYAGSLPVASNTSNTFSNTEIYFPNYTNTTSDKVFVSDGTAENNTTAASLELTASRYPLTSAITSISIGANVGTLVANSTATLYGVL